MQFHWICLLSGLFTGVAFAQGAPPVGSPELFYIYLLQSHEAMEELAVASAAAGNANVGRVAAEFGVSPATLSAIENAYAIARQAIASIEAERNAYVLSEHAKGDAGHPAKFREFYSRRLSALLQVKDRLRHEIGEQAWSHLEEYLGAC